MRANENNPPRLVNPPSAALFPGALLLFAGLWMVSDGGPLVLGWVLVVGGAPLVLVGAVAAGVAWGLDLHDARRR